MGTIQPPLRRISVCEPFLNGNELDYVLDAVKTTWISSGGKYLKSFESGFAAFVGVRHAVGVTNGTTALHLALVAAGISPGDEVILPDFTMIAPAFATAYCGAKPVFVDADPHTWCMDVGKIEEKITPRTKAILAVHIYGHPVDMDPLLALAKRHNLLVIEDAAEVHGAEYKGRRCGSLSNIAAFSFYANKNITTGEGGMVVTDNDDLAHKARYYKNLCFPMDGRRTYVHDDIGFNYRMNNLQAAIGLAQLEKIEDYVNRRRTNARLYNERLAGHPLLQRPIEKSWAKNCYWMYGVVLSDSAGVGRDQLMDELMSDGIETRAFFGPMHTQPSLKKHGADCSGQYPVSERLSKRGFYLPSGSNLTEEQIDHVCQCLKKRLR